MKPTSKQLLLLILFFLASCSGCKEKYKITGLGDHKLGNRCLSDYSYYVPFMFFSETGVRATPKSCETYSVYYRCTYSWYSSQCELKQWSQSAVGKFYKNLNEVIIALKEKYADCCPRQYELQEKPVTKEFITQLISRAGSPNVENSWQMVFEACDKNRHIGVFISDDECALDFGKKRAISCRIKLATEMEIVLAAWDDDLLHQNNRERAKIISDGL